MMIYGVAGHWSNEFLTVSAIVTLVFLVLSTISGCSALFSQDFKRCLRPLFTKLAHHLFALTTFVSAVVAICYTLIQQKFTKRNDPGNLREVTSVMLAFIMLFTLIGPLKTLWAYRRSLLNR
jgi:Eukaryotic cytochrome b561